jgi:chromosome segregation ATPase
MARESQEDLLAQEQRLIQERDAKQTELDERCQQCEQRDKQVTALTGLADKLRDRQEKLRECVGNLQKESLEQRRQAADQNESMLRALDSDIRRQSGPLKDAKSQYELVVERCTFVQDAGDAAARELGRQIDELRYNQQMLRARAREVQARVDGLNRFIREKRPDLHIPDDEARPKSKKDEKDQLEAECRRLQKELDIRKHASKPK